MLLKKKEEAVGRKTTPNGVFLPVSYLRTGLPDQLWVMEPKSYSFVSDIIENVINKETEGVIIQVEASRQAPYLPKRAPKSKNITSTPCPNVSNIITKYEMISHFKEG